jgi:exodeoxyribonuclease III
MRLMSYNIFESGEGRIDPVAEVIRQAQPDVVVILEAWDRPQLIKLADRLGMEFFHAESPTNPQGHNAMLSRWPIREAVNYGPLEPRLTRAAFHAIVDSPNGLLPPIVGVHLHPRETLADEAIRLGEVDGLLDILRRPPFAGQPHIVAGDFNCSHPQQIIDTTKVRQKTRDRVIKQDNYFPRKAITGMLAAGYVDAHAIGRAPEQFQTSFTTSHPAMRVDYVFVTASLATAVKRCEYLHSPIGKFASDHFPIVADLDIGRPLGDR